MKPTPLRLLMNDDTSAFGQKVRQHAEPMGIVCEAAVTPRQFEFALDKRGYDLIFVQLLHPEIEGLWALRQISRVNFDGSVVLFNQSLPLYSRIAEGMAGLTGVDLKVSEWPISEPEFETLIFSISTVRSCMTPGD